MAYPSRPAYQPPGRRPSPPRNPALIGGIVVACTALVLGSILLVTFVVNRGGSEDTAEEGTATEATSIEETAEEASDETAEGDPEEVAVAVVEVMFGLNDADASGLVCADPGMYLTDLETTSSTMSEMFGETSELIDGFVASGSSETEQGVSVDVSMVVGGVETSFATVDVVVEDGSWKACDLSY